MLKGQRRPTVSDEDKQVRDWLRAQCEMLDRTVTVDQAGTGLLVNATRAGLYPDVDARLALDPDNLCGGMAVVDIIPDPSRTRLLRDAAVRGCQVLDGIATLMGQGRIGIECWTGIDPDERVMRAAVEEVFAA